VLKGSCITFPSTKVLTDPESPPVFIEKHLSRCLTAPRVRTSPKIAVLR
jgi:hypothetical protein